MTTEQEHWNQSTAVQAAATVLAVKALHVIDDAIHTAMDGATSRAAAMTLVTADYRVRDAVLTLAATGHGPESLRETSVCHRLTQVEFDASLIEALGHKLRRIAKELSNV